MDLDDLADVTLVAGAPRSGKTGRHRERHGCADRRDEAVWRYAGRDDGVGPADRR